MTKIVRNVTNGDVPLFHFDLLPFAITDEAILGQRGSMYGERVTTCTYIGINYIVMSSLEFISDTVDWSRPNYWKMILEFFVWLHRGHGA